MIDGYGRSAARQRPHPVALRQGALHGLQADAPAGTDDEHDRHVRPLASSWPAAWAHPAQAASALLILSALAASTSGFSICEPAGPSGFPVQRGMMWKCRWNTTCPPAPSLACRSVIPSAPNALTIAAATF